MYPALRAGSSGENARVGRGLLLILLAAVTWGTTGTTLRLLGATSGTGPLVVGLSRMVIAAPLLGAGAVAAEGGIGPRNRGFLLAGLCMGAYQAAYFSAVARAGVGATAVLAICSAPLMIAVLSAIFLRERIGWRVAIALVAGLAGTILLVGGASITGGREFGLGAVLALTAGLLYAVFAVVTRGSVATSPPLGLAALTFATAALVLAPVLLLQPDIGNLLRRGWPLLLYLGAIPTALAYGLYTVGLRTVTATVGSIVGLAEPLTAAILGVVLFREVLGPAGVAGGLTLMAAVALLATGPAPAEVS